MNRRFFNNQLGQTAVEYCLLIAVSASLGIAFFKKMDDYVINNPNGIIGKPIKIFKDRINQDTTGRYTRFPLRRAM
jgi:Flp pilus assembly pilin Flp